MGWSVADTVVYDGKKVSIGDSNHGSGMEDSGSSSAVAMRMDSSELTRPPLCTLLEYGNVKILCNVGWDEHLDYYNTGSSSSSNGSSDGSSSSLQKLRDYVWSLHVDVILLTDSSLSSLGGLCILFGASVLAQHNNNNNNNNNSNKHKYGSSSSSSSSGGGSRSKVPPVYATFPTVKMGQMTLYEHHAHMCSDGPFDLYNLEDVDAFFSPNGIHTLKYAQSVTSAADGVQITPHMAGHLVGACYYILCQKKSDETQVVVAPIYHHAKERHLDSTTLFKYATACDVFITTAPPTPPTATHTTNTNSNNNTSSSSSSSMMLSSVVREEALLVDTVLATLRRGGHVLLPVDASGRVMELLLVLNQYWEKHRLASMYNLVWVGPMVHPTSDFVQSQLEWMAQTVGAQFNSQRGNPFALSEITKQSSLRHHHLNDLDKPTCFIASGASLDHGPARDLFLQIIADDADNCLILTDSRRCVPRPLSTTNNMTDTNKHVNIIPDDKEDIQNDSSTAVDVDVDVDVVMEVTGNDNDKSSGAVVVLVESESESDRTRVKDVVLGSSTARQLLCAWYDAKLRGEEMPDVVTIEALVPQRQPLQGQALQEFVQSELEYQRQLQAQEERRAMLEEIEYAKSTLRLVESTTTKEPSSTTITTNNNNNNNNNDKQPSSSSTQQHTPPPSKKLRTTKTSRFDPDMFLKFSKPCHCKYHTHILLTHTYYITLRICLILFRPILFCCLFHCFLRIIRICVVMFEVREEAVGIGQSDSVAKYGIGESIGKSGQILEDDYGISIQPDRFLDIVSGMIPGDSTSKFTAGIQNNNTNNNNRNNNNNSYGLDGSTTNNNNNNNNNNEDENNNGKGEEGEDGGFGEEAIDLSEGRGIIRGRNGRPPIQVSTITKKMDVLAEIVYIPLEGRVDARAAKNSIRALQPRQVVWLSSKTSSDPQSKSSNNTTNSTTKHHFPSQGNGHALELDVGHAAYSVRLIDTPYLSSKDKEAQQQQQIVVPEHVVMEPYEAKMGECTVSLLDCVATGKIVKEDRAVVLAPAAKIQLTKSSKSRQPIMLSDGDVLLTDLRSELIAQGMKAEYTVHPHYTQLIINGRIIVRKDESNTGNSNSSSGRINVEGPLCQDFFTVRQVVCSQYVTLS